MPDMNCREIRSSCEENPMDAVRRGIDQPELAEHLSICAECSRFVEAQSDLGTRLQLLRDSAPAIRTSLDVAVLAKYRDRVAVLQNAGAPGDRKAFTFNLRWVIPVAAALVLVVVFLLSHRKATPTLAQPKITEPVVATQSLPPVRQTDTAVPAKKRRRPDVGLPKGTQVAVSAPSQVNSLPEEFRSLMYCDDLSCGEGMELLRVQIPPRALGIAPSFGRSQRVVEAEVLVGADGIARGIRLVQ
jgi:hypothetical protein